MSFHSYPVPSAEANVGVKHIYFQYRLTHRTSNKFICSRKKLELVPSFLNVNYLSNLTLFVTFCMFKKTPGISNLFGLTGLLWWGEQETTNTCLRTHTYLTHYLNVGDPLGSGFGHLIRQDRQDKVSGFGQRLSHQVGVRLVTCLEELLCVGPRQVTVVPPETQRHRRSPTAFLCTRMEPVTVCGITVMCLHERQLQENKWPRFMAAAQQWKRAISSKTLEQVEIERESGVVKNSMFASFLSTITLCCCVLTELDLVNVHSGLPLNFRRSSRFLLLNFLSCGWKISDDRIHGWRGQIIYRLPAPQPPQPPLPPLPTPPNRYTQPVPCSGSALSFCTIQSSLSYNFYNCILFFLQKLKLVTLWRFLNKAPALQPMQRNRRVPAP